jgi:hypothetical protein
MSDSQSHLQTPIDQLTDDEYLALGEPYPHRYPGRGPSNASYAGPPGRKGCRCPDCRAAHASYTRDYLQAKIDGTWTDKRKRSNTLLLDALDRCGLTEEQLLQFLVNHGAAPAVIPGSAEEVSREPMPGRVTQPPTLVSASEPGVESLPVRDRMLRLMREAPTSQAGGCRAGLLPRQRSGSTSG